MHVAFVNLWWPPTLESPAAVVAADPLRRALSHALLARGLRVTVIQEWREDAIFEDRGAEGGSVTWRFVRTRPSTRALRALLGAAGRHDAFVKAPSTAPLAALAALHPDLIHSFDLTATASLALLGRYARGRGIPLVVHFHGGAPARMAPLRALERHALSRCDRLLFTARAQGLAWVAAGALPDDRRLVEVFETTTLFSPGPAPRLEGAPACLAVGRLDAVKDPLTLIEGFRRLREARPGAVLHLAYTEAPARAAVERAAAGLPVRMLGRVEDPQPLYRGADLFLQASTREVCGRAPLEAMASGLVPVLSDIPAFRRLTGDGAVGRLFRVGDPDDLARAALSITEPEVEGRRARAAFEARLSPAALARDVLAVYESCAQERRRSGPGTAESPPVASQSSSSR